MLVKDNNFQAKLIVTTLEELMPQEHFLRDLSKTIDFSFIYKKVEHLYPQYGRPSVDPVVLIKMLLLGFLYGIDSERKIEKEVQVNIAFRWFLGINLDERIPDHSTISQTRRRKFKDSNIFEDIFAEVVKKCMEVGLVDGSLILTDSTHIKASASMKRKEIITVAVEPSEYVKKLNALCDEEDLNVRAEAVAQGKQKRGYAASTAPQTKTIEKSTTDPDCGVLSRPGKPGGFHYINHQSVDGKSGIITDVFITPGNVDDCVPFVGRIKHQLDKYGFPIHEVGMDKGYDYIEIHKEMHDLGIKTYTPLINNDAKINTIVFPPSAFRYNYDDDSFTCPAQSKLVFASVNKSKRVKIYAISQKICQKCPLKAKCMSGNQKRRVLSTSFHQHEANVQRANYGTPRYYEVQRLRRIYCEGNFALQKDNHNLRATKKRGNHNVTEHCLLSALALNIKRLVKYIKGLPVFICIKQLVLRFSIKIQAA
jgi:transposase